MAKKQIYHYTMPEALHSILCHNYLCLWGTRFDKLNDPNEQMWAANAITPYLLKESKTSEKEFDDMYAQQSFILSFCRKPDDFNMWRLYCNEGKGIMLSIDFNLLFKESEKHKKQTEEEDWDMVLPVFYAPKHKIDKAFKAAQKEHDKIYEESDKIENALAVFPFVKNSIYKIEKEVRYVRLKRNILCFSGDENNVYLSSEEDVLGVKYRMRGSNIIPYIEIHIPTKALKAITIGYNLDYESMCKELRTLMNQYGNTYSNVKKKKSLI